MSARVDKFKLLSKLYFFLTWSLYSVIHRSRIFSPALSSSFLPIHSAFVQMAHNQGAFPNTQAHKYRFLFWYLFAVTNCKVPMPFFHTALTFQVITTFLPLLCPQLTIHSCKILLKLNSFCYYTWWCSQYMTYWMGKSESLRLPKYSYINIPLGKLSLSSTASELTRRKEWSQRMLLSDYRESEQEDGG